MHVRFDTGLTGPIAIWVFVIVLLGATLLFLSFLPGWINVVRTKDTSSMSLRMWVISVVGLFFLTLFYALGIANTTHYDPYHNTYNVSVQFIYVFVCEALSLLLSIYILVFKLINMRKAKRLGMTEEAYCASLRKKHSRKISK